VSLSAQSKNVGLVFFIAEGNSKRFLDFARNDK
jgi:hypothetical protein